MAMWRDDPRASLKRALDLSRRAVAIDETDSFAYSMLGVVQMFHRDYELAPGRRLRDWIPYWHGAFEYRDQSDFDHLFDALRKAGLQD